MAGDDRDYRRLFIAELELLAIAPPVLAHITQRILRAAPIGVVENHQLGQIEHVDLFELGRRAIFRRHHIDRDID
jgi:hypothetical protein